ncbi:hypothetical protein [Rhodococcus sp. YH1]|nr:hypothetical protein [Rhodococcus sp. YH1]
MSLKNFKATLISRRINVRRPDSRMGASMKMVYKQDLRGGRVSGALAG